MREIHIDDDDDNVDHVGNVEKHDSVAVDCYVDARHCIKIEEIQTVDSHVVDGGPGRRCHNRCPDDHPCPICVTGTPWHCCVNELIGGDQVMTCDLGVQGIM